jgi:hypothetical protein
VPVCSAKLTDRLLDPESLLPTSTSGVEKHPSDAIGLAPKETRGRDVGPRWAPDVFHAS